MKNSFVFKSFIAAFWTTVSASAVAANVPEPLPARAPSLTSPAAAQLLLQTWFAPRAADAAAAAAALHSALSAYCSAAHAGLEAPRSAFAQAIVAWEHLGAVALGPQVARRTARTVDFQPLRPAPFNAVLAHPPQTLADMEVVGGPAKGFAAIENLLWEQKVAPKTSHCAYATLAAAEIHQEFQDLETDLQKLNTQNASKLPDFGANAELLNQWLGGLDRLRWLGMEKPLRSATPKKPAQLLRATSGLTIEGWVAQWQGLRAMAAPSQAFLSEQTQTHGRDLDASLQAASDAAQLNIATLVYARGWQRLAAQWTQAVLAVDAQIAQLRAQSLKPAAITAEALAPLLRETGQLRKLLESDIAPALQVTIGFSDADGD